jgi:hypothetical protein
MRQKAALSGTLLPMNTIGILDQIDAEIATLQQARDLITGSATKKRPGRPKSSAVSKNMPKPKRGMSAEGRARIAAAQRKRWAAQKKTEK